MCHKQWKIELRVGDISVVTGSPNNAQAFVSVDEGRYLSVQLTALK